jgi:hypothetical protein
LLVFALACFLFRNLANQQRTFFYPQTMSGEASPLSTLSGSADSFVSPGLRLLYNIK